MKEALISVTAAARKFSDCINRVRYQGMSFLLEKNGVPVARIVPVQQNFGSDFEHLTATLRQTRISSAETEEKVVKPHSEEDSDNVANADQKALHELKRSPFNW